MLSRKHFQFFPTEPLRLRDAESRQPDPVLLDERIGQDNKFPHDGSQHHRARLSGVVGIWRGGPGCAGAPNKQVEYRSALWLLSPSTLKDSCTGEGYHIEPYLKEGVSKWDG